MTPSPLLDECYARASLERRLHNILGAQIVAMAITSEYVDLIVKDDVLSCLVYLVLASHNHCSLTILATTLLLLSGICHMVNSPLNFNTSCHVYICILQYVMFFVFSIALLFYLGFLVFRNADNLTFLRNHCKLNNLLPN